MGNLCQKKSMRIVTLEEHISLPEMTARLPREILDSVSPGFTAFSI